MTGRPAFDSALAEVFRAFGIEAESIESIASGRVNQHWRVTSSGRDVILRRYSPFRAPAAIAFEHAVPQHAAAMGWPVAIPLRAQDGGSAVQVEGAFFALFPMLPGVARVDTSLAHQRIKGRLLARLHRDMAGFAPTAQREGFGRLWELDPLVQSAGAVSFNDLLARFGREHSALAAGVRRQRYRSLRELARLGYGDLPAITIHGDFQRENLLFDGGELTGLLDFDSCRCDAAAADLAASAWLDCLDASGDRIHPGAAAAFIEGYAGARPLLDQEQRMLPALVRAQMLWFIAFRLMQWLYDGLPQAVESIARTVNRRFPALDAVTPALERALAAATPR